MSESPVPVCGWCSEPAVTDVITRPGRKLRKTSPVCEAHAKDFEKRGIPTTRLELDEKLERERKRGDWFKRQRGQR